MFFSLLSPVEKRACLSLFYQIAQCDEEFHQTERLLMAGYSLEMGIENREPEIESIDNILEAFSNSAEYAKKAVFLESVGLIVADNRNHIAELDILNKIQAAFGLSDEFRGEAFLWVDNMLPHYIRGFEIVGMGVRNRG